MLHLTVGKAQTRPSETPVKTHLRSKQRLWVPCRSSGTRFCKPWPVGEASLSLAPYLLTVDSCFCAVTRSCDRERTAHRMENTNFLTHYRKACCLAGVAQCTELRPLD